MTHYLIGRCLPLETLFVARTIRRHGAETTVPVILRSIRKGANRGRVLAYLPMLPGFLFVEESNAMEARESMNAMERRKWRFMQSLDGIGYARVRGEELEPLINYSLDETDDGGLVPSWVPGQGVEITLGPFAGETAVVEATGPEYTCIRLDKNRMLLKITPFLLRATALP